ncbi:MAG: hypothetical protein ACRC5R_04640 [Mycoplasmatales bacterium]
MNEEKNNNILYEKVKKKMTRNMWFCRIEVLLIIGILTIKNVYIFSIIWPLYIFLIMIRLLMYKSDSRYCSMLVIGTYKKTKTKKHLNNVYTVLYDSQLKFRITKPMNITFETFSSEYKYRFSEGNNVMLVGEYSNIMYKKLLSLYNSYNIQIYVAALLYGLLIGFAKYINVDLRQLLIVLVLAVFITCAYTFVKFTRCNRYLVKYKYQNKRTLTKQTIKIIYGSTFVLPFKKPLVNKVNNFIVEYEKINKV